MAHTWSYFGDTVSDATHHMYYRGQRIREAYCRGEKIWGEDFLGAVLAHLPDKLHYASGEAIDYTGVKILGVWEGGRTEDITEKCEFLPEEGTVIDPSTVLIGIVVAQLPNKTTYSEGETLNYAGVVILAVYADWHTVDVTSECVFTPKSGAPAKVPALIGIFVTKLPTKTAYVSGDEISYDGVVVMGIYTNGMAVDITAECAFTPEVAP